MVEGVRVQFCAISALVPGALTYFRQSMRFSHACKTLQIDSMGQSRLLRGGG